MSELLRTRIFGDADELAEQLSTIAATVGMNVYDYHGNLLSSIELWDEGDGVQKLVIR